MLRLYHLYILKLLHIYKFFKVLGLLSILLSCKKEAILKLDAVVFHCSINVTKHKRKHPGYLMEKHEVMQNKSDSIIGL